MSDSGYVRIYRSLIGHPAFRNDGEAMAFAWMVLRASWRDTRVRYKGRPISLSRGQLAVSVRDLAEHLDRPKGWIERLLKRLKNETMVGTHSETGVMVISICNYDDYQADADDSETVRRTDAGQTQDRRRTQNKEGNKGRREEESTPPTPSRSECDDLLDRWNAMAVEVGLQKQDAKLTEKRKRSLKSRIRDDGFEEIARAIEHVPRSGFLMGRNDRGWKADLDFFLRPDTVTKILEGKYDDRTANGNGRERRSGDLYSHLVQGAAEEADRRDRERAAGHGGSAIDAEALERHGTG